MVTPALKLDDPIEDVAERLGKLFSSVPISREPMFSWLHITNDATVLGEELRRDRREDAADRAGRILIRLLEFLGYYLYCHQPSEHDHLANLVAKTLRQASFEEEIKDLKEGPSRWILWKFPYSCSKCGQRPCHCMVYPLVLENRREDPERYVEMFKEKASEARKKLNGKELKPFTLQSLFEHFGSIFENSYHYQDPWKIGMHLYEEIGEATTELSRIYLQLRAQEANFKIKDALAKTFGLSKQKLDLETGKITNVSARNKRAQEIDIELQKLRADFEEKPWDRFEKLVRDKFKEEVSDVFSWIAAVILRLDPKLEKFKALLKLLSREGEFGAHELVCKYCRQPACDNVCLVTHSVSAEITEKLSKF